jgi:hypothetical protein
MLESNVFIAAQKKAEKWTLVGFGLKVDGPSDGISGHAYLHQDL